MLLPAVLLGSAALCGLTALLAAPPNADAQEPNLPSWNEGASKQAIMEFVGKVTRQGGPDYVPPAERIAAFDGDGTLWAQQPLKTQLVFALDRVKTLSPQHPEWTTTEPFASVLRGDIGHALAAGEPAIVQIVTAARAGMTTQEFEDVVRDWMTTAKHPKTGRLYSEMVYQPMLGIIVRHTDAEREWAYDVTSSVGKLDAGLDHAQMSGWAIVDMKKDWNIIFSFEKH